MTKTMVNLPVQLLPGEQLIDSWMLIYKSPVGERSEGICTVTNHRIFYDTKGVFETGPETVGVSFFETGRSRCIVIDKNTISQVKATRTALEQKVVVTMSSGQQHEFNYGALNIDRIVDAMNRVA